MEVKKLDYIDARQILDLFTEHSGDYVSVQPQHNGLESWDIRNALESSTTDWEARCYGVYWGAELSGGLITSLDRTNGTRRIEMIMVDDEHRRTGVGRALMKYALENDSFYQYSIYVNRDDYALTRFVESLGFIDYGDAVGEQVHYQKR